MEFLPVALKLVIEDFILFSGKICTITRFEEKENHVKKNHKTRIQLRVVSNLDGVFYHSVRINDKFKTRVCKIQKRYCKDKTEVFFIEIKIPVDWAEKPKLFLRAYEFI